MSPRNIRLLLVLGAFCAGLVFCFGVVLLVIVLLLIPRVRQG